ncbi:MAG: hypothetical protein AAGH64_08395 [Planctomycetota bacterium]
MARPTDPKSSVRDILAKLDRSIDQARAKRMETETGQGPAPFGGEQAGEFAQDTPEPRPGQARPLRARPLRSNDTTTEPDPGGKWIGRTND